MHYKPSENIQLGRNASTVTSVYVNPTQ